MGKRHGKGVLSHPKVLTYTGDFQNDLYHGKGKLVRDNVETYEG